MAAFQMAEGQDFRPRFHRHAGPEDDARTDHRVPSDHGIQCKPDRGRVAQRHPVLKRPKTRAVLKGGFGRGQLGASVDAQRFPFVAGDDIGAAPLGPRQGHQVGQVIFPRGVLVGQPHDQLAQQSGVKRHDPGIAQRDVARRRIRVLVFDDPFQATPRHDQAAIAARILGLEPQDDQIGRVRGKGGQRFFADEWGVAVKNDHRSARRGRSCPRPSSPGRRHGPRQRSPVRVPASGPRTGHGRSAARLPAGAAPWADRTASGCLVRPPEPRSPRVCPPCCLQCLFKFFARRSNRGRAPAKALRVHLWCRIVAGRIAHGGNGGL